MALARNNLAKTVAVAVVVVFFVWRLTQTPPEKVQISRGTTTDLIKWVPPVLPEDLQNAEQSDPRLADHIRDKWVLPPFTGERNLKLPPQVHYSQRGQSEYVDKLLKEKRNGFFIEVGAANGEALSNSLFFEKSRDWSGLLIEANPLLFKEVMDLRRHTYMVNACLSPKKQPVVMDFRIAGYIGGLTNFMDEGHKKRIVVEVGEDAPVKIQCFPLASMLQALKVTHVDFFSLDIEGAEVDVLRTFPFGEIQVDVITIEYIISGAPQATQQKLKDLRQIMVQEHGYTETDYRGQEDVIFTKGV